MRLWPALALLAFPTALSGQVGARVAAVEDGVARLSYETRAGVEICSNGVRLDGERFRWRSGDRDASCGDGPAVVEIEVRGGVARNLELRDSGRRAPAVDLGAVGPEEARAFFLSLIREGREEVAKDAVMPLALADVTDAWRDLLAVAKDVGVPQGARKQALFWVGREAATAAVQGLEEVALDRDEDQEVRNAAIFALSQRSPDEAVPVLMELARSAEEAETRRRAMFWLAQLDDDRVLDFFEEVLLGRGR